MASPSQSIDVNARAIPVLTPDESTVVQAAIAAGNNTAVLPSGARVVEVAASDLCRIKFGPSTVDATTGTVRVFPAGVAYYKIPVEVTHIAVTQVGTSSGFVTVAEMK